MSRNKRAQRAYSRREQRIERSQLRVGAPHTLYGGVHEHEQPHKPRCGFGVPDIGLDTAHARARKSERSLAPRGLLRGFTTAASLAVGGGYAWHNYQNRGWIYKVVRDNQRRRRASITGAGSSLRYGQYATMTPKPKYKKPHDL